MSEIALHLTDPALTSDDELLHALRLGDERAGEGDELALAE